MNKTLEEKDLRDREAMEAMRDAVQSFNAALSRCIDRRIKVDIGPVSLGDSWNNPAKEGERAVKDWTQLWGRDGIAVRFLREEVFAAPVPVKTTVKDQQPQVYVGTDA